MVEIGRETRDILWERMKQLELINIDLTRIRGILNVGFFVISDDEKDSPGGREASKWIDVLQEATEHIVAAASSMETMFASDEGKEGR